MDCLKACFKGFTQEVETQKKVKTHTLLDNAGMMEIAEVKLVKHTPMGAPGTLQEKIVLNQAIIESFNTNPADPKVVECVGDQYFQHNLVVPDTKAGYVSAIGAIFKQAREAGVPLMSKVHRSFADPMEEGYTWFHAEYNFFGPKFGFDICRWEDGKIVEHWDNLMDIPEGQSVNGHTLFDGPIEATDMDKTEANKEIVRKFTFNVLCAGLVDQIPKYVAENYIQHDPNMKDGRAALSEALSAMNAKGVKYLNSRHVLVGCGNFVLCGGQRGEESVWDMYRVEGGLLVEHWGNVEDMVPVEERAHQNGKW